MYIDIAKAFEFRFCFTWDKLLSKLRKYGVTGIFLLWVKAFLTGRRQCVKVGETRSNFDAVTSGVPCSILGPLLFLVYINDLSDLMCWIIAQSRSLPMILKYISRRTVWLILMLFREILIKCLLGVRSGSSPGLADPDPNSDPKKVGSEQDPDPNTDPDPKDFETRTSGF